MQISCTLTVLRCIGNNEDQSQYVNCLSNQGEFMLSLHFAQGISALENSQTPRWTEVWFVNGPKTGCEKGPVLMCGVSTKSI